MAEALPSEDEVLDYFRTLSNWGRWGSDDEIGTLNLITDAKRARSANLVRVGRAISCAYDIDTELRPDDFTAPPQRFMLGTGQGLTDANRVVPPGVQPGDRQSGVSDYLGMAYHGYRITHLDALCHISWDARLYNDRPAELVTVAQGATVLDVRGARSGIVTRGLLIDVPRYRGVRWLEPGEFVTPSEAVDILANEGLEASEGDALLLRTGYGRKLAECGPYPVREMGHAGWHASCLPWFRQCGAGVVGADVSVDVIPSGYDGIRSPIHGVGITAMGLWLMDNCNLELLAVKCEALNTWECQFVVAPMPFAGATGSPVNPIAVL